VSLRAYSASLVAVSFVLATVGCSAAGEGDVAPPEASALTQERPAIFIPTVDGARSACAEELAQTYCDEDATRAAKESCVAKLSPADRRACEKGSCLVEKTPQRDACRAGKTYSDAASCAKPVVDDCSYYRSCVETDRSCGDSGYALKFGERFCYVFLEDEGKFSPEGRVWLRAIRTCLQDELVKQRGKNLSCQELEEGAFASHSTCYVDPQHSICDLSAADKLTLTRVVAKNGMFARAFNQIEAVTKACASQLLGSR